MSGAVSGASNDPQHWEASMGAMTDGTTIDVGHRSGLLAEGLRVEGVGAEGKDPAYLIGPTLTAYASRGTVSPFVSASLGVGVIPAADPKDELTSLAFADARAGFELRTDPTLSPVVGGKLSVFVGARAATEPQASGAYAGLAVGVTW